MRVVLRRQLLTVGTEVNTLAFDSPMIETGGIQRHWSHKSHDFRRPFSKKSTKPTEGAPGRSRSHPHISDEFHYSYSGRCHLCSITESIPGRKVENIPGKTSSVCFPKSVPVLKRNVLHTTGPQEIPIF